MYAIIVAYSKVMTDSILYFMFVSCHGRSCHVGGAATCIGVMALIIEAASCTRDMSVARHHHVCDVVRHILHAMHQVCDAETAGS